MSPLLSIEQNCSVSVDFVPISNITNPIPLDAHFFVFTLSMGLARHYFVMLIYYVSNSVDFVSCDVIEIEDLGGR
jgi:hypothetical protein